MSDPLITETALIGATCRLRLSDHPDAREVLALIRGRFSSGRILIYTPRDGATFGVPAHRVTVTELPPIVH